MEVDINTMPGLLSAVGNHGGLQNRIEIYDKGGNAYKFIAVYPASDIDDDETDDIICFDVELLDGGALDINNEPTGFTEKQIERMIAALESTGRYDVVGRRW